MIEKLKSRKLLMALMAVVIGVLKIIYPDFPDQALYTIVGSIMGYVAVEGAVDASSQLARWLVEKKS